MLFGETSMVESMPSVTGAVIVPEAQPPADSVLSDITEPVVTTAPLVVASNVEIADGCPSPQTAADVDMDRQTGRPSADEEWRRDIWRSYGTREVRPPSPMGLQRLPSVILGTMPSSPTTPVELWSSSSDDEPWGLDSPRVPLEVDSQPAVPGWPHFTDDSGKLLDPDRVEFHLRVSEWSVARTVENPRHRPKRRHHLRSRRAARESFDARRRPTTVIDWVQGRGVIREPTLADVQLPSPPAYEASLLRHRREMRQERLPKGFRVQPSRSAKRRRLDMETSEDPSSETGSVVASRTARSPALPSDVSFTPGMSEIEILIPDNSL